MKKYFTVLLSFLFFAGCHPQAIGGKQISQKSKNYYKGWFGYYYSPGNNTFELGFHPLDVDSPSFEVLGVNHAKDKNQVFYKYTPIKADPATFVSLCDYVGKDKKHVFDEDKIIEKVDPITFGITHTHVLYDKNYVFIKDYDQQRGYYYRPSKIKMDIDSVEELYPKDRCAIGDLLRDKNGVYAGDIKQSVDVASFKRSEIRTLFRPFLWEDKNNLYSLEWKTGQRYPFLRKIDETEKREIIKQYQEQMAADSELMKKTGLTIQYY